MYRYLRVKGNRMRPATHGTNVPMSRTKPPHVRKTEETIRNNLKQFRIDLGLHLGREISIAEAALLAGVNAESLRSWEGGRRTLKNHIAMMALAEAYGREVADFSTPKPGPLRPDRVATPLLQIVYSKAGGITLRELAITRSADADRVLATVDMRSLEARFRRLVKESSNSATASHQ